MKIIFNGDPDDAVEVVELVLRERKSFFRDWSKIGWGWCYGIGNGRTYFLRRIKDGVSAALVPQDTPSPNALPQPLEDVG